MGLDSCHLPPPPPPANKEDRVGLGVSMTKTCRSFMALEELKIAYVSFFSLYWVSNRKTYFHITILTQTTHFYCTKTFDEMNQDASGMLLLHVIKITIFTDQFPLSMPA